MCANDHCGKTRVKRNRQHCLAAVGDVARDVERVQHRQQFARLFEGRARRLIEKTNLVDPDTPRRKFQGKTGEVDLENLGFDLGATGAVLGLWPQTVRTTRPETAGATGTLVGRRATDVSHEQFRHARVRVETGRAGETRIDDDTNAVDREGALRNVGRKDDATSARTGRCQCRILFVLAERAGKGKEVDVGIDDA